MKNKYYFFAILCVSIILLSCERESISPINKENPVKVEDKPNETDESDDPSDESSSSEEDNSGNEEGSSNNKGNSSAGNHSSGEDNLGDKDGSSDENNSGNENNDTSTENTAHYSTRGGNDSNLSEDSNIALSVIFNKIDAEQFINKGSLEVTKGHLDEIKSYTTDNIVKGAKGIDAFKNIFKWIRNNVKYAASNNNPYEVFKNKLAICYGYSNITKAMMISQGFPCLVVTGILRDGRGLAHSWNYSKIDGRWMIIDATSGRYFYMDDFEKYKHLDSSIIDVVIFEDKDFAYNYEYGLNITKIKATEEILSIPYTTKGYVINCFNPRSELPTQVKELYISDNIKNMGEKENAFGLSKSDRSLKKIYVKDTNPVYEDYKNVLYKRGEQIPLHIPYMMKRLELRPMAEVEKNTVFMRPNLEVIEFATGTHKIEAYAVENCPKVKKIIIPKDAEVAENAFVGVSGDLKIVRK